MKVVSKDSILIWKDIEDIKALDLNDVMTYKSDGKVFIKYELTPIAYILLSPYCKRCHVRLLNNEELLTVSNHRLERTGELILFCKKDDKSFEINYKKDMKIKLSCSPTYLKVMILQVQADVALDSEDEYGDEAGCKVNYVSRLLKIAQQNKDIIE